MDSLSHCASQCHFIPWVHTIYSHPAKAQRIRYCPTPWETETLAQWFLRTELGRGREMDKWWRALIEVTSFSKEKYVRQRLCFASINWSLLPAFLLCFCLNGSSNTKVSVLWGWREKGMRACVPHHATRQPFRPWLSPYHPRPSPSRLSKSFEVLSVWGSLSSRGLICSQIKTRPHKSLYFVFWLDGGIFGGYRSQSVWKWVVNEHHRSSCFWMAP